MLYIASILAMLTPGPTFKPSDTLQSTWDTLPDDPFQRCATKALRGMFGEIPEWKRQAYEVGLALGLSANWQFVVTQYNAGEGRQGRVDCHGRRCGWHTAASNLIPQGFVVWIPQVGLRIVCDRGAKRNDRIAAAKGGIWIDIWFPSSTHARKAGIDGWLRVKGTVIPVKVGGFG